MARYSIVNNGWSYRTRRDGLPSDQIQAITFDSFGTCYAGTQTEGIAIGHADNDFSEWDIVKGPDTIPAQAAGEGLPSSQITDILACDDDTVYAATKYGLARSKDQGASWTYIRGIEWQERAQGRTRKLAYQPLPDGFNRELLREDYVTNLAEGDDGLLYIGYRQKGWEARRPLLDRVPYISAKDENAQFPYVTALWPQTGGPVILGSYPGGVKLGDPVPQFNLSAAEKAAVMQRRRWKVQFSAAPVSNSAPLPAGASAPRFDEIEGLLKPLSDLTNSLAQGEAVYEADDWRTKGDWVGRYGRQYAVMCAARAPLNHYINLDPAYSVEGRLGPHIRGADSLRHWVHWVKTDNPNTLYDPICGYRRQAEWDDHGETYPWTWEGPDVWAKVVVPDGTHRLSLHFFNKDGLGGNNRARDYLIELKRGELPLVEADAAPALVRTRVHDFWNAVYKRFVVRGPASYWVKVGRDGSFNTILDAVFLDKITGPRSFVDDQPLSYMGRVQYAPPEWSVIGNSENANAAVNRRARIWEWKLDAAMGRVNGAGASSAIRILALRALMAAPRGQVSPDLLARWRWNSQVWVPKDRNDWKEVMENARNDFLELNPKFARLQW